MLPSGNWGEEPVEPLLRNRFDAVMDRAAEDFDVHRRPRAAAGRLRRRSPDGGGRLARCSRYRRAGCRSTMLRAHADQVRALGARVLGVVLIGRRAEPMVA